MKRVALAFACFGLPAALMGAACTSPGRGEATGGSGGSGAGGAGGNVAATGHGGSSNGNGGSTSGNGGSTSGVAGNSSGNGGSQSGGGGSGVAGNSTGAGGGTPGSGGSSTGKGGSAAGGSGAGGSLATRTFPTQACIDKATSLLGMMTSDEKISQVQQAERKYAPASDVTQYGIGSVYSEGGSGPSTNTPTGWADMIDALRKAALASRLKIPIVYGLDSVHGAGPVEGATVFPHNIGLGATRDAALVEQVAQVASDETAGVGADFPFAPVIAVARDERWGRTYEAFGETPDLVGAMGAAYTNGLQRRTGRMAVLGNAKHFAGDGGTANGVNTANTSGDETTLRAIHVDPYNASIAAGVGSIMASYSSWQGVRMHQNKSMLTDLLKGTMGFKGFIGSDYNGCFQNGVTISSCLDAGIDMFMTAKLYDQTPNVEINASTFLTMMRSVVSSRGSRLDDAVKRILTVKCEMGLFDTASPLVDRSLTSQVGSAAHRTIARQAVRESMVLLKNDNTALPISKTATVALTGMTADHAGNQCGGWTIGWQGALSGTTFRSSITGVTTIKSALETALGGSSHVVYSADGSSRSGATVGVVVTGETPYAETCGDIPQVLVNGKPDQNCVNRTDSLDVPSADVSRLQAYKSAGLKTVLVLVVGRPLFITDTILQAADAIVVAWLPGSEGGGVSDVLVGDYKPTGKLPRTWPRNMSQIPINYGDSSYDPQFAYGFGLSYP
jgi:beta-glucosidase